MRALVAGLSVTALIAAAVFLLSRNGPGPPRNPPGASAPSSVAATDLALTDVTPERAARLLAIALADPWLVKESVGHRVLPVEISNVGDGKTGVQVRFVDYTGLRTLLMDFSEAEAITSRSVGHIGAANYSPAERADASALALADATVQSRPDAAQLVVNNVTGGSGPNCAATRCLAVFLLAPGGDRPLIVTVDLASRQVVGIHEGT
jgi:hypothetical protein